MEILFKEENAACMSIFQARLKFWNIELLWFDTSAGEPSTNNRRSWIFRKRMLRLTCKLKKVQCTNKAVMMPSHQRWKSKSLPRISWYVLLLNMYTCYNWGICRWLRFQGNLNNLEDVFLLSPDNYCQIRTVLLSAHSGFSAFIPMYCLFKIATITTLPGSFHFTISPPLSRGVQLTCLYAFAWTQGTSNIWVSDTSWSLTRFMAMILVLIELY